MSPSAVPGTVALPVHHDGAARPDASRRRRRARRVLVWTPAAMTVVVGVDVVLGERAEYFDAASLLRAWVGVLTGHGTSGQVFLLGQERIGQGPALVVGSVLLVAGAALAVAAVQGVWRALAHAGGRRRRAVDHTGIDDMRTDEGES